MAIIQITRIQIRRGPEADLPGAPTNISPLAFSEGLGVGEFGFASDTGRLFIGHDPSVGQPNYNRVELPWRNIEVLTENSGTLINRMISELIRYDDVGSYFCSVLNATSDDDWLDLEMATPNDVSSEINPVLFEGPGISATLDYSAFDSSDMPFRHGTIQISHPGDNTQPSVIDEAIGHARLEFGDANDYNPSAVYGSLRFRAIMVSAGGSDVYKIQYQNPIEPEMKMFFRISRIVSCPCASNPPIEEPE